jgi:hypothetical protein
MRGTKTSRSVGMRVMNNTAVELRGRYIVAVGEKIASSYAFRKIRKGVCFNRAWRYNWNSDLAFGACAHLWRCDRGTSTAGMLRRNHTARPSNVAPAEVVFGMEILEAGEGHETSTPNLNVVCGRCSMAERQLRSCTSAQFEDKLAFIGLL